MNRSNHVSEKVGVGFSFGLAKIDLRARPIFARLLANLGALGLYCRFESPLLSKFASVSSKRGRVGRVGIVYPGPELNANFEPPGFYRYVGLLAGRRPGGERLQTCSDGAQRQSWPETAPARGVSGDTKRSWGHRLSGQRARDARYALMHNGSIIIE